MNELTKAVQQLRNARYTAPETATPEYLNAVADMATETAYHLRLLGITFYDLEANAHTPFGTSIEQALTGPIFDIRKTA